MPDEPRPKSSPRVADGDATAASTEDALARPGSRTADGSPAGAAGAARARRKTPGVPQPPLPQGEPRRLRRFVLLLVAAAVLVVALTAGFNAVVDPYGTVGTGLFPTVTWSDRSLKTDLIGELSEPPDIVILGSSRAMKFEPSYIETRTGHTAFNAGVSSGRPVDAWAFTNLIEDTYPEADPGYLWLLDVEAFRSWPVDPGLVNTPELARYLPEELRRSTRLKDLKLLVSLDTAKMSARAIRKELRESGASGEASSESADFDADGFRRRDYHDARAAAGVPLATELRKTVRQAQATYRSDYRRLDPEAKRYFEKTLALMNEQGSAPVIVLSPQHPQVTAAVGKLGWNARHRQLLAYLRSLQGRYDFTVLDLTDTAAFGGDPNDYYDGYHLTVPNTRRLIDAVMAKAPGALKPAQ